MLLVWLSKITNMAQQEYKMLGENNFSYKGTVLTFSDKHDLTPELIDSLEDFEKKDDDIFCCYLPQIW